MNKIEKTWYIYTLSDPINNSVRYVGWCFIPTRRLAQHIQRAKSETTHKSNWINKLSTDGLTPLMDVVEVGTGDWAFAEKKWIAFYRGKGLDLVNLTDGGEGVPGLVFSAATREKMAAAKRGRKHSQEHIEKVAATRRGVKRTVEAMAGARKALTGRVVSQETKEKIRASLIGTKHTDESRAKISAAGTGRKPTTESNEKRRAAMVGRTLTEAHKEKLSLAKRGRMLTEAHKAAIKESSGGWSHTPETIEKIKAARNARVSMRLPSGAPSNMAALPMKGST